MRLRKREPLQAEKMPHLRRSRNLRQEVDNFRSLHTEARQKVAGLFFALQPSLPMVSLRQSSILKSRKSSLTRRRNERNG
jgi:hypothetical protein